MTINEILKLEIKKTNLRKIETFINHSIKDSYEYYTAVSYKALMFYRLSDIKEAITLLLTNLNETKSADAIISYCDSLIEIYLDLSDFEKANKYIELKDNYLKPIDKQKHTRDLILYYAKRRNITKASEYINLYLNDDISQEDRIFVVRLLLDYSYEDNKLEDFLSNYDKIIQYYLDGDSRTDYERLYLYKLNILYKNNKLDEDLKFIRSINIDSLNKETRVEFYTVLLMIHLDKGLTRKAAILDSEYEPVVNEIDDIELKKKYYNVSLKLYKKANNNFSTEYVLNKLKSLENNDNKVEKKVKSGFKDLSNVIIERVIEKEEVKKDERELQFKNSDVANIDVSNRYNKLNKVLELINHADQNISFRELLRQALVELNKNISFSEAVMFIKDSNIKGYHFKADRLYDKDFSNTDLSKSILNRCVELNKDIYIENIQSTYYNQSIIHGTLLEFNSCMVFPIYYDSLIIGAFGYFFKEKIEDNSLFEYFKFITEVFNTLYKTQRTQNIIKNSNDTFKKLEEIIPVGIKTIYLDKTIFNETAKNIFNINTLELSNTEYLDLLNFESQMIYKNAINSLLYNEIKEIDIYYYLMDNKYIKEHLLYSSDNIILSYIEDLSVYKEKENKLLEYAYSDNFTKALSYKAFKTDSQDLFKNHDKAIALIDSNQFKLYEDLYGYDFANQVIYSIGNFLVENQKEYYSVYHLDSSRFILVFNMNDKRSLKKHIDILLSKLTKYLNNINKRVNLKFSAGIFRQSSKDRTYSINEMLSFATEALLDSICEEEIIVYDNKIYNHSFFVEYENELSISEAIDNNRLDSVYIPIYDLEDKNVLGYFYKFSLDNLLIGEDDLNNIVYKRHLEYKIDKYKISHVLEDLKMFYNKTGYFLNIFIPIYAKTLTNPTFITYLNNVFNFFKINSNFVSFKIVGTIDDIKAIELLKNSHINLGVSNIDDLFKYKLDSLYLKFNDYTYEDVCLFKTILRKKRLILTDVNDNESIKEASLITRYITGKTISKMVSINNLINQALNKEKK